MTKASCFSTESTLSDTILSVSFTLASGTSVSHPNPSPTVGNKLYVHGDFMF